MVAGDEDRAVDDLFRLVIQLEERYKNSLKKAIFEAVKLARRWRNEGKLQRLEGWDGSGSVKWLKRG